MTTITLHAPDGRAFRTGSTRRFVVALYGNRVDVWSASDDLTTARQAADRCGGFVVRANTDTVVYRAADAVAL